MNLTFARLLNWSDLEDFSEFLRFITVSTSEGCFRLLTYVWMYQLQLKAPHREADRGSPLFVLADLPIKKKLNADIALMNG